MDLRNEPRQALAAADGAATPLIALRDVAKTYSLDRRQSVSAVAGVSLEIARGEFLVITGRSGSGKTTLLNLVAGLTRPTSGQVILEGIDLWSLSDAEQSALRNAKIGFIFQFPSLIPSLSVLENVALPALFGPRERRTGVFARATGLLDAVGLSDKLPVQPRQLSKGQQQRVVIARALVNEPEIIVADEATSDLDEQTEGEIMAYLGDIHKRTGVTILMVTHASQLARFGTRSLVMKAGAIAEGV